MKIKVLMSFLLILFLADQSNCQKLKIESPSQRSIYDLNKLTVNFSCDGVEGVNDSVRCEIFLFDMTKSYYNNTKIYDDSIKLISGSSSLIEVNVSDSFPKRDTISACKLKIIISYKQKSDSINKSIDDSSNIFCLMNCEKYDAQFPFKFNEIKYRCLFNCEQKIISLYKKQRLMEIFNRKLENDQQYDDSIKKLTEDIKKREDDNQKTKDKETQNRYWKENDEVFNWRPVQNEAEAKLFYTDENNKKTLEFLQNSSLNFNFDGNASLYSDIISTYMGPVRISIGNLISNNANPDTTQTDTTQTETVQTTQNTQDAIQKLVGGGGNLLLRASYPLFVMKADNSREISPTFLAKSLFFLKAAYDIPGIGTLNGENLNFSIQYGVNLDGNIGTPDISFVSNLKYTFIWGTAGFRKNLGVGGDTDYDEIINMFKADFGLNISNKFIIGANLYFGCPYVCDNFKPTVFFTVIP